MNLEHFKNLDNQSPFVLILIGPPLSGKTFFIKKLKEEIDIEFDVISRDEILMEVYGSDDYNKAFNNVDQKEVDKQLLNRLKSSSYSEKNVIIDMTNMKSKRRRYNLSFFQNYYKIAVIFPILSDEEYEKRNAKRTKDENKTIPMSVIKNMISSYQPIKKQEEFDRIISL
jgi:tRNA uridine 5-carbamoylmethylation protein Kti12